MQYAMFVVMRDVRGIGPDELVKVLLQRLDDENEPTFSSNKVLRLHGMNGRQIHRLLARMTEFMETRSGMPSHYAEYARRGGNDGYEIEHIWAIMPTAMRTSSRTRRTSRSTAIESVTCCYCRRASTRAMATCRTRRSSCITTARTCWRAASTEPV